MVAKNWLIYNLVWYWTWYEKVFKLNEQIKYDDYNFS